MDKSPKRDTTKRHIKAELGGDKILKHCGQWLTATLIARADWKNLTIAGLLAGETILVSGITLISIILLLSLEGPFTHRFFATWQSIHPWFPIVILGALLSMVAAHLAQWAEQRFSQGRGRQTAALALVPVAPIVFAIFLTPSLFAVAPLLSLLTLWVLGSCWWSLFIVYLRRLTDWDYLAILNETTPPSPKVDWLYEHRQYLENKRTALIERKQRLKYMDDPTSTSASTSSALASLSPLWSGELDARPRFPQQILWILAIVVMFVIGGFSFAKMRNQGPNPAQLTVMPESAQPSLTFWYQLDELEASVLKELVKAYTDEGTPVVDANQIGDFPILVQRAYLVGDPPDVMLMPDDLAYQFQAIWGSRLTKIGQHEPDQLYFPLWPDQPWRQRLFLVISPETKYPDLAQDFVAYLTSKL